MCDDSTPCQSCLRDSIECKRIGPAQGDPPSVAIDNFNGEVIDGMNGIDQCLTDNFIGMNDLSTLETGDGEEHHWLNYAHQTWSQPFPTTGLNASSHSDSKVQNNAPWPVQSDELGYVQDVLASSASEDSPFHLPSNSSSQTHPISDASWTLVDQPSRSTSSCPAQASASPGSSNCDQSTDLRAFCDKDLTTTKKLIAEYFTEINPCWPILHAPSFNLSSSPYILLSSMLMLVSWSKGNSDHLKLAPLVFDAVIAAFLVRESCILSY